MKFQITYKMLPTLTRDLFFFFLLIMHLFAKTVNTILDCKVWRGSQYVYCLYVAQAKVYSPFGDFIGIKYEGIVKFNIKLLFSTESMYSRIQFLWHIVCSRNQDNRRSGIRPVFRLWQESKYISDKCVTLWCSAL